MPGGAGKEKGGEEEHNLLSCGLYAYVAPGGLLCSHCCCHYYWYVRRRRRRWPAHQQGSQQHLLRRSANPLVGVLRRFDT